MPGKLTWPLVANVNNITMAAIQTADFITLLFFIILLYFLFIKPLSLNSVFQIQKTTFLFSFSIVRMTFISKNCTAKLWTIWERNKLFWKNFRWDVSFWEYRKYLYYSSLRKTQHSRFSNNAALQQTFIMLFTSNFDDNISKIIC